MTRPTDEKDSGTKDDAEGGGTLGEADLEVASRGSERARRQGRRQPLPPLAVVGVVVTSPRHGDAERRGTETSDASVAAAKLAGERRADAGGARGGCRRRGGGAHLAGSGGDAEGGSGHRHRILRARVSK